MKARLLVPFGVEVEHGPLEVHAWPIGRDIPEGWEEIEVFTGSHWSEDRCLCGHARKHHSRHGHDCLENEKMGRCSCKRFRRG